MLQLVDPTLDAKVDAARSALDAGRRFAVVAPPGSGQSALLDRLGQQLGHHAIVRVDVPPLDDPDAPFHALLQVAARLGGQAVRDATNDATPIRDRAYAMAQELAVEGRTLLVWLSSSWRPPRETAEPGAEVRYRRAEALLDGWLSVSGLRCLLVYGAGSEPLVQHAVSDPSVWQRETLTPPTITAASLEGASWGSLDRYVRTLRDTLHRRSPSAQLTAAQARLLVGLVALGESPNVMLSQLASQGRGTTVLENTLRQTLRHHGHAALRQGVQRFLYARVPLPRAAVANLTRLPPAEALLLTECFGDGGSDYVRAQESLREALGGPGKSVVDSRAHIALADYHEALDGASAPTGALASMVHWLEKVHHLGRSGAEGAERWKRLDRPARELYWDRARSLSIEHHDYLGAAKLYRECLERFDAEDAYCWHYIGFNLDRAAAKRPEAERAFRKAVELKPNHPWYNGRLVTFLIEQARFRDADQEWRDTLERMDPTGEGVMRSPWLVGELHAWVVKAWLRFGEVRRARATFDSIPSYLVDQTPELGQLEEQLEDAEEAVALGESVYPSATPLRERWVQPQAVVANHAEDGAPLRAWYPGRIAAVDDTGVHLALAVPDEDPDQRRLIARTLTHEEWKKLGWSSASEAERRFVYLAIYGWPGDPERVRISAVPDYSSRERDLDESEDPHRHRYLTGARK
jgi:tetratricopeptide (TPR) repeat protein